MVTAAAKKKTSIANDPLDITPRLYKQLDRLLDDMESADRDERMTMPQRISGMIALGRIMKMMQDLRKGDFSGRSGTAIDKYSAAFASPNAASRGATLPRSTASFQPDSGRDEDDGEYDDDDIAAAAN